MSTDTNDHAQVQERLWRELSDERTAMLGIVSAEPQHFQPMTAFVERETNDVWFFTYKDTDLAEAVGTGAQAMLVFQRDKIWACIGGRLTLEHDAERMNKYWGPVVAAWYPEGKDDPRLTMLRLNCEDAQVWISDVGPAKFAWEIARANATRSTPDLGGRADLNLH
jgi:general stress protein 26